MVLITRRASLFLVLLYVRLEVGVSEEEEEGESEQQQQHHTYQFTQGYNILTTSTLPNPNLYHAQ